MYEQLDIVMRNYTARLLGYSWLVHFCQEQSTNLFHIIKSTVAPLTNNERPLLM